MGTGTLGARPGPGGVSVRGRDRIRPGRRGARVAFRAVTADEYLALTGGDAQAKRAIAAMLPMSRAVLRGGPLSTVLDRIAAHAADVVPGADRASIILIEGGGRFRLGGSHGLSERYKELLSTGEAKLRPGDGPSGVAYERGRPVVISDVATDPVIASWSRRDIVREEGYGAIISLPLIPGEQVVGTLNLYRAEPAPWTPDQVRVLQFFAEHAAGAVRTAQLLDQRAMQVSALERLVRTLREQTHEHANRLHAIKGLLALDEVDEAKELLQVLEGRHSEMRAALDARIHVPVVAGLVLADAVVAAQRGISLVLDERSALPALPPTLSDTQVVTILGNLLDNAFDAVADAPPERRRVRLLIAGDGTRVDLEVADGGPGLPEGVPIFERGRTTKAGHDGVGLALVREAVSAAMGTIEATSGPEGTTFRVAVHG